MVLTKCDQCRAMWKERNERGIEGEPPCAECWVDPLPENEDAWKIFNINRYQLIMAGMDGQVIDMDHTPIHEAMRLYRIRNRQQCFEKVLTLARWWVQKLKNRAG